MGGGDDPPAGQRWQQLHRLVYIAALAAVIHFYWLVKADIRQPFQNGAVLALLLGYRLVAKCAPLIAERFASKSTAVVRAAAKIDAGQES